MRIPTNNRGVALVEFALVALLLITLAMGILDFGTLYFHSMTLNQAAEEGARAASLGRPADEVETVVKESAATLDVSKVTVTCFYRMKVGNEDEWPDEWTEGAPGEVPNFANYQVKVGATYLCNRLAGSFFGQNPAVLSSPDVIRKME